MSVNPVDPVPAKCDLSGLADVSQQEFDYMVAELQMSVTVRDQQWQRFEQQFTLYLTGATAIGGGIVLVLTSELTGNAPALLAGLLMSAFALFGFSMILRMCAAKVTVTSAFAIHAANRLYFQARFPDTVQYVESRPLEELYETWSAVFTRQVRVLFISLIAVNSGAFALGCGLILYHVLCPWNVLFGALLTVLGAVIAFLVLMVGFLSYFRWQLSRAQAMGSGIIACAMQPDSRGGPTHQVAPSGVSAQ